MPRDTTGDYILPSGNPVAPGTIIQSAWANTTMEDVAEALTNSLDRNGRGGMLAPFKFFDGSEQAPGAAWATEPTTGLWRESAGDLRVGVLGNQKMRFIHPGNAEFWDADTSEWEDVFGLRNLTTVVIGVNTTAASGKHYHCAVGALEVTLPAAPEVSDVIAVSVGLFDDCVVLANGNPIAGNVEDVGLDLVGLCLTFQYVDETQGWVITSQALSTGVTGGLPTAGQIDGDLLRWDLAGEKWTVSPVMNIGSDNVVRGYMSSGLVNAALTNIVIESALPGTVDDNAVYLIPGVGVYVGSVLVAEMNP